MSKKIALLLTGSVLLVLASGVANAAADDTFDSCESAYNYGANTSYFYVSASMNRASCDGPLVEKAEQTLARALKRQKIAAHNPEGIKVCFYAGLYEGYVDGLASEAAECSRGLALASVARAAATVFAAMHGGLASVNDGEVDQVFDGVFTSPGGGAGHACDGYLRGEANGQGLSAGLDELVSSVCWNN